MLIGSFPILIGETVLTVRYFIDGKNVYISGVEEDLWRFNGEEIAIARLCKREGISCGDYVFHDFKTHPHDPVVYPGYYCLEYLVLEKRGNRCYVGNWKTIAVQRYFPTSGYVHQEGVLPSIVRSIFGDLINPIP